MTNCTREWRFLLLLSNWHDIPYEYNDMRCIRQISTGSRQVEFTVVLVLTVLFRFWTNIVIIRDAVQTGLLSLYISLCVRYSYLLMADVDSRNMLQCTIKHYCTGSMCCVWSDN
jgi:hypothetical protein